MRYEEKITGEPTTFYKIYYVTVKPIYYVYVQLYCSNRYMAVIV